LRTADPKQPTEERETPIITSTHPVLNSQFSILNSGRLELDLACIEGVTRARRSLAQPPLQLSRVRYDEQRQPGTAVFTLLHLGGVLAGDRVAINVALDAGASAQIHMAAATQVYQMQSGDAQHRLDLRLAAGSRLAWLAQPLILFGGARFSHSTRVTLAPGARLDLVDVLVPGRLARGERYEFQRYAARLELYDAAERCLIAERILIEPRRSTPARPGVLGATPVVGSLYLLGDTIDAERCAAALHRDRDESIGVTTLPNDAGLLVRALGATASQVHNQLLDIWRRF
jgi:urease accessory protein